MPTTLLCPSCNTQLQVPDDMRGTDVQCPSCGLAFRLPSGSAEAQRPGSAAPAPPMVQGESPSAPTYPAGRPARPVERYPYRPGEYDEDGGTSRWDAEEDRRRANSSLQAPAICLLVTGILGLLGQAWFLLSLLATTPAMVEKQMPPAQDAQEREIQKAVLGFMLGPVNVAITAVCMAFSVVVILGAVMMLIRRMRWLAVLGSFLAIINVQALCCVLGLPIGIWSLVVLLNPRVAAAFEQTGR